MEVIVGISGASGAIYAKRLLEQLTLADVRVHLCVTSLGRRVLRDELGLSTVGGELSGRSDRIVVHGSGDMGAAIASGSFIHQGMVVVPCSSNTLAAIATGLTNNLVQRAASVALKERRRLVLAHRETPLSHVDICNMKRASEAGAIILPLAPGFYMAPRTTDDLVDFMVGRMLDLLGIPHALNTRWTPNAGAPGTREL